MSQSKLYELGAAHAATLIACRELKSEDLVRSCLERVSERDTDIHAFAHLDALAALAHARALDSGPIKGLLHGLPLGVKDLFDTADLPTSYGSSVYANHRPVADAASVAMCREAGAVVLGKTVTSEFAFFHPGPTCNPHHRLHTPGGSSSGSAAAVADRMLPLALGTQTSGSIIRPAAFCGIVGYKPTNGRVMSAGVKSLSPTLDVIGGFGRSVPDAALLGAVLTGDTRLMDATAQDLDNPPRIGLFATPNWGDVDADIQTAWIYAEQTLSKAGASCTIVPTPTGFESLVQLQKEICSYEMAHSLSHERLRHRAQISAALNGLFDEGMKVDGISHAQNLMLTQEWRQKIQQLFVDHDVILTPSTLGEAPLGLDSTGDPLFCRSWTLLGLPCVHIPFATGHRGLPVGLQLVAAHGDDHRLLAAAHWVHQRLTQ
jgi:Asp-tRNA(Asn)/Glu-tRNA(Gln) amidotransferase A subunit family amidase